MIVNVHETDRLTIVKIAYLPCRKAVDRVYSACYILITIWWSRKVVAGQIRGCH